MAHLLVSVASIGVGVSLRKRLDHLLGRIVRLQYVLVAAPLCFLGGLLFQFRPMSLLAIAVLQVGEIGSLLLGASLHRRRHGRHGIAFAAGVANSGIWAIPVAAAFLNPAAVAFLAVYGSFTFLETAVLTRSLRRFAPSPPSGRTALADYASAGAVIVGLLAQLLLGRPAALLPLLRGLALLSAVSGAAVIGLATPLVRPGRRDLRAGLHGVWLRFGFAFPLLLGVAVLTGRPVPPAAWIVALAPCYANILCSAALYGYRRREAAATVLATTGVALPLLPVALFLGSSF